MGSVASDALDAKNMTADEFTIAHPEITAATDRSALTEFLFGALRNDDVASREILANRFLDWGADPNTIRPDRINSLQVFASRVEDPVVEAPLFKRLLDLGADPNLQSARFGMLLDELMNNIHFTDQELAPIFDVLFERPNLDFFIVDRGGDTLWDRVWRKKYNKPDVVSRTISYIVEHTGTPPPPPQFAKKQPDKSWLRFNDGDVVVQGDDGVWRIAEHAQYSKDVFIRGTDGIWRVDVVGTVPA